MMLALVHLPPSRTPYTCAVLPLSCAVSLDSIVPWCTLSSIAR